MGSNTLQKNAKKGIYEAGREGATNTNPALDIANLQGGRSMPAKRQYTDSVSDFNTQKNEGRWRDACKFRRSLACSGWKTPNTYDNHYEPPTDGAAVYLFLLHGWDSRDDFHDFDRAMVAYVGMSEHLSQRWAGHSVLGEIEGAGRYVQKWFLPTSPKNLRHEERNLIQKFDPPWNIQGRRRGVLL